MTTSSSFKTQRARVCLMVLMSIISGTIPVVTLATVSENDDRTWHAVIAVGAGTSTLSNASQSHYFPIQNPVTDEFFQYSANKSSETRTLFEGFLGTEWNFGPHWALQAGFDYNQASNFSSKGALIQGADLQSADTYSYRYSLKTRQLLLDGKLLYTIKERFHPYLLAGIGAAFNRADDYDTNVPFNLTFTRVYKAHTTTSFSYAAGLGIDADITDHLRAGIGYRYADLGKVKLGDAVIDTTPVAGSLSQSHLHANEVLVQLTWII